MISQQATVIFNCLYLENGQKINEFEEVHKLHYYFFQEMHNLLKMAGFSILHQSPFMEVEKDANTYDWNISIVARKEKRK
jgi:hypothetical protein